MLFYNSIDEHFRQKKNPPICKCGRLSAISTVPEMNASRISEDWSGFDAQLYKLKSCSRHTTDCNKLSNKCDMNDECQKTG